MWWVGVLGCHRPLELATSPGPMELSAVLEATSPRGEVSVQVACTAQDDPSDRLLLALPQGTASDTLFGLRPDTTYDCVATADGHHDAHATLAPRSLPFEAPLTHLVEDDGDVERGYTLLNHQIGTSGDRQMKLLIYDRDARLRWYAWGDPDAYDLDASFEPATGAGDRDGILFGGGYGTWPPQRLGLDHQVQWLGPPAPSGQAYNHHVERQPDGSVLTVLTVLNTDGKATWIGASIVRIDPDDNAITELWNTQQGFDQGFLRGRTSADPYHVNAVVLDGDSLWVSCRSSYQVLHVDVTTGLIDWGVGPNSDFTLTDELGSELDDAQWFYGQHAIELEDDGRLLLYDNGTERPDDSAWSSAVELELDPDVDPRLAALTWRYTEPDWFEPAWGDVDRQPDGRVVITKGHCGLPCGPDKRSEVVEVDPDTNTAVWRLAFDGAEDGVYRSQRIDACALFTQSTYCPALASTVPL